MDALLATMAEWAAGSPWERGGRGGPSAAPAEEAGAQAAVLGILDATTAAIVQITNRKSDTFRTLRQGLAYCWSVAVVAERRCMSVSRKDRRPARR